MKTILTVTASVLLTLFPLSECLAATNSSVASELKQGRKIESGGEPKQALPSFQKAVDLATAKSANSLELAEALCELGECYRELGDNEKAIPLLNRSIEIAAKDDAGDHGKSILAASLTNLALLQSDSGHGQDAYKCYQRCLDALNKMQVQDKGMRAKVENNMGLLMARADHNDLAIKMYERALENSAGDDSLAALRVACLGNIAMSYKALKDLPNAERYGTQAVEEGKQKLGTENLDYGWALAQQGMIYFSDHKYEEAKAALEESLKLLEHALGSNHPELSGIKSTYAECLAALKTSR